MRNVKKSGDVRVGEMGVLLVRGNLACAVKWFRTNVVGGGRFALERPRGGFAFWGGVPIMAGNSGSFHANG